MKKSYKLLKDLPDVKAGAIFEKGEVLDTYFLAKDKTGIRYNSYCYGAEFVEANPEWFEPVVEREWEIVKGSVDPEDQTKSKILSVKRLSDNEVFSVGDFVSLGSISRYKIIGFVMEGERMLADIGVSFNYELSTLNLCKTPPQQSKQPERIEVVVGHDNSGNDPRWLYVFPTKIVSSEKFPAIKQAIEDVLNDSLKFKRVCEIKYRDVKQPETVKRESGDWLEGYNAGYLKGMFYNQACDEPYVGARLYTEQQLNEEREKAFNAGRAGSCQFAKDIFSFDYFEDYLNSIK